MGAKKSARWGITLALMAALAGCQSLDSDTPGGGGPDTPGAGGPGTLLLQIDTGGGFVPMGYDFRSVPDLTVYADGRVIVHGPQIEIWPPPALPNLQVEQLSDAELEALITAAMDAGLLGEIPDYGQPAIADAPSTFVTLVFDGREYVHVANALGLGEGGAWLGDDVGPGDVGLTQEQLDARITLQGFLTDVYDAVGATGDGEPYEITAFAIQAWAAPDLEGDLEFEPQVLPWPLETSLADVTECIVVDGADAEVLLETLAGANLETRYSQDGAEYQVFFRPLLPHENECEGL